MMDERIVKEINKIFHEIESIHYDSHHPEIMEGDFLWWDRFGKEFIMRSEEKPCISILDIGSGTGFVGSVILKYLKSDDTFVCYDISPKMLSLAREKLSSSDSNVTKVFLSGDAESLPFKNNSFDIITANAIIHHLPNFSLLFMEIDRILKTTGLFAVAHEQTSDFFKSRTCRILALLYKIVGGKMAISNAMQHEVNNQLKEQGLISKNLSKDVMMSLVDFHSPIEQSSTFIDAKKGISPELIIDLYFPNYKLMKLRKYSTFFHRAFLEKNKTFQLFLKTLNNILLKNNGPLFSLILKKY